ncbi:hypothetical protein [Pedobacter steynii]
MVKHFGNFDATKSATYKTQKELTKRYEEIRWKQQVKNGAVKQMMANAGKPWFSKSYRI